jgi:hypothetical protein
MHVDPRLGIQENRFLTHLRRDDVGIAAKRGAWSHGGPVYYIHLKKMIPVARAAIMLVLADALVRALPFATIARWIRREMSWTAAPDAAAAAVSRVGWATAAACRRLPWTIRCLAQAVAANRMLAAEGVPSELWLGVNSTGQPGTDGHAWLVAQGRTVTGRAARDRYVPVTAVKTPPPRPR